MIAYSQCWEDASLVIKALKITANDVVLSVTSGGCNTLAIANSTPALIYSVDCNNEQNYLLELKLAAIQNLSREKALAFLGYRTSAHRPEIFLSLAPFLSHDCRLFWQLNSRLINEGVVHSGKFEKYLHLFRKYILPLVHGTQTVRDLVTPKSNIERVKFYHGKWNTFRWRLLFKIFFSKAIMSGRGRSKQMFAHFKSRPIADIYAARVKHAFTEGIVTENFYLNYILFKEHNTLPLYLENLNKQHPTPIKIVTQDVLSFLHTMPDNSISKFNLSDIFEALPQAEMDDIMEAVYRVATSGARIIYWNNLVLRDINENKRNGFTRDYVLEDELIKLDKIFFYDCFYIYKIEKP